MQRFERVVVGQNAENITANLVGGLAGGGEARAGLHLMDEVLRRLSKAPEGRRFWPEDDPTLDRAVGVGCAWWTDAIGRKHARIRAGEGLNGWPEGKDNDSLSALALVYPDACILRRAPVGPEWQVLCGCGLFGSSTELGWMGERCAACHDRIEEGAELPGVAVIAGHRERITSLAFLANGRELAATDLDCVWGIWDIRSGQKRRLDSAPGRVARLARSSSGNRLAVRHGSALDLLDVETGRLAEPSLAWLGAEVLVDLACSPDGTMVAALGPDGLRSFDGVGRAVSFEEPAMPLGPPLRFSPDGRWLAAAHGRGVIIWKTGSRQSNERIHAKDQIVAHAFAPDGEALALALRGSFGDSIALWNRVENAIERVVQLSGNHWNSGNRLVFHPDGRVLLATFCNRIIAWDVATGEVLADLEPRLKALNEIAVSPDGALVATGSDSGTIRLWPIDLLTGGRT
jgi:hypothetical protein